MDFLVERIKNKPIDSNCYVIYLKKKDSCVIVDPGTEDCYDLIEFIQRRRLNPEYILLTHEHFDHIWGVNKLKKKYSLKVLCSDECAERIMDKKKNLSVFYDQKGFSLDEPDYSFHENVFSLKWQNKEIELIKTKGHSEGCITIYIENFIFTGDTIIKNEKTILKLPGSNREELVKSLNFIKSKCSDKTIVYPGHGDFFEFNELNINNCL